MTNLDFFLLYIYISTYLTKLTDKFDMDSMYRNHFIHQNMTENLLFHQFS